MPDICMCRNIECPLGYNCYRFRAIPDRLQSYAAFSYDKDVESCNHFIAIEYEDDLRSDQECIESVKRLNNNELIEEDD